MSDKTITGDAIIGLRQRVLESYEKANADNVTRPGAFGLCAHIVQQEMECDFRVACMLVDCWIVEHSHTKAAPS
jgi:hypothetical protein